ncbi:MAG: double-strand break repair protein AddB [Rhodobacteraceae bacterium]|nr:double-strand break repair protein AddB [Paracoccaceae bacterium]
MFEPCASPRVFALPPGLDFAAAFLDGLRQRLHGHPPEAMAGIDIWVNTRRTERRLHQLLLEGPPGLMPRIRVITDLAREPLPGADLPPPVPPLRRRLDLSRAIAALLDQAPELAPRAAIFDLADSLADLMDEMRGEGVAPDIFRSPVLADQVADHAAHWQRSLKFLDILSDYFTADTAPDIETRQRLAVEHLADKWQTAPPQNPVLVAGSTGSRGATSLFMQQVSRLPQGAVILPGFDFDAPASLHRQLADPEVVADHPQAGLSRFVAALGLEPADLPRWTETMPASVPRNRLISLALRPAPVTDQWLDEGPTLWDIAGACASMSLVEAASQRAEAMTIAFRLRASAEAGQRATLISPDRQLTRQVTAALERWHILPDDSGGRPLPLTPPGVFLRLVAALRVQPLTGEALLSLLKHPLTNSAGAGRAEHLLTTRRLELACIRGKSPFPDLAQYRAWATAQKGDVMAAWADWLASAFDVARPEGRLPLSGHLAQHRALAEVIANGPAPAGNSQLWQKKAGEEAARVFAELEAHADAADPMSAAEYEALLRAVLNRGGEVREPIAAHPLITIWGTLEARVQGADLVILGGLNDGTWPQRPAPDPWLSRPLRKAAGLLLPERRIGLSAHDFQQAIAAPEVMLTRSLRDADAPTVASRWVIRLTNLLTGLDDGRGALAGMRERGRHWLALAAELERPRIELKPEPRPSPRPPLEARPDRLSVTQIRTLIRDPYAIYARKVLRLERLDPVRREPDAMLRGQALHSVLEEFVRDTMDSLPPDAADALLRKAESVFARDVPWPATRRLWLARLARIAAWFVAGEQTRRQRARPMALEVKGRLVMTDPPFTLTGKADRIDITPEGGLIVIDYKSGAVPTGPQIRHFDKQMPLEGKMIEAGAFEGIAAASVAGLQYISLASSEKDPMVKLDDDLINQTWEGLRLLIRAYRRLETGYTARAAVEKRTDPSDYDHLSRRGEWDDADPPEPKDVP